MINSDQITQWSNYDNLVGNHYTEDKKIFEFFNSNKVIINQFHHIQKLNLNGFKGRILSTSYSPRGGDDNYEPLILAAKMLFNKYQTQDYIDLHYECKCYIGRLDIKEAD